MSDQYPVTEYNINLRTSVSKDEAVAKMLGLLRGAVRGAESSAINADLKYSPELTFDLADYLQDRRERAIENLIKVFAESSDDAEKANSYYEVLICDKLINELMNICLR